MIDINTFMNIDTLIYFVGVNYSFTGNLIKSVFSIKDFEKNVIKVKNAENLLLSHSIQITLPNLMGTEIKDNFILNLIRGENQNKIENHYVNFKKPNNYNVTYLNSQKDLNYIVNKYKIEKKMFPNYLPLKVWKKNYPECYIYKQFGDTNINLLFLRHNFKYRLPLSLTFGIISLCGLYYN